jgi:hypothetical protein
MTQILSGKKAICQFMGMGWSKIERWILERAFPATKIDGVWESDVALITAWRQEQISARTEKPKRRQKSLSR